MMFQTEEATPEGEVPAAAEPAGEFVNIAIDMIATGPQVRTDIDPAGESIGALAESIRERGIIQPLTVCRSGDGYFLVVGERRLAARGSRWFPSWSSRRSSGGMRAVSSGGNPARAIVSATHGVECRKYVSDPDFADPDFALIILTGGGISRYPEE